MTSSRRNFLKQTASLAGATVIGSTLLEWNNRVLADSNLASLVVDTKLIPVKDENTGLELLKLPEGFSYRTFGWTGDLMSDGFKTPEMHDGMAIVQANDQNVVLIRNHELSDTGNPIGNPDHSYDVRGPGGCTGLVLDTKTMELKKDYVAISGTARNCAGGPTPWNTWLTCEEVVCYPGKKYNGKVMDYKKQHGWIFEVGLEGSPNPQPLKDMGCFWHEAIAVDPNTGYVYETEDRNTSGFYRFIPNTKSKLADGGTLQAMVVEGATDLSKNVKNRSYNVSWIDVDDPHNGYIDENDQNGLGVYFRSRKKGSVNFARLEGAFWFDKSVYFTSTSGGDQASGQVWEYVPSKEKLNLVFESPDRKVLDYPDNLTVAPCGTIVLCEDSDRGPQRMHALTSGGKLSLLAANNTQLNGEKNGFKGDFRTQEWAGASFTPDGKWLIVNVQTPGFTVAITGPWENVFKG